MLRTIATSSLVSLRFERRYLARYVNSRGEEGMRCEIGTCVHEKIRGLRWFLFKTVFKIHKNYDYLQNYHCVFVDDSFLRLSLIQCCSSVGL